MNYISENEIKKIISDVVTQYCVSNEQTHSEPIMVEVSARHVHLTAKAAEALFGPNSTLTFKRDLSQGGEFLSNERVRLVTPKGTIDNISVLGPVRNDVQIEVSMTDAYALGINPPINISGNMEGASDAILIGPCGVWEAPKSVIVAKAHVHMTPKDALFYNVKNNESIKVQIKGGMRPITFDDVIVRVKDSFKLAMHIDYDEGNACHLSKDTKGYVIKK